MTNPRSIVSIDPVHVAYNLAIYLENVNSKEFEVLFNAVKAEYSGLNSLLPLRALYWYTRQRKISNFVPAETEKLNPEAQQHKDAQQQTLIDFVELSTGEVVQCDMSESQHAEAAKSISDFVMAIFNHEEKGKWLSTSFNTLLMRALISKLDGYTKEICSTLEKMQQGGVNVYQNVALALPQYLQNVHAYNIDELNLEIEMTKKKQALEARYEELKIAKEKELQELDEKVQELSKKYALLDPHFDFSKAKWTAEMTEAVMDPAIKAAQAALYDNLATQLERKARDDEMKYIREKVDAIRKREAKQKADELLSAELALKNKNAIAAEVNKTEAGIKAQDASVALNRDVALDKTLLSDTFLLKRAMHAAAANQPVPKAEVRLRVKVKVRKAGEKIASKDVATTANPVEEALQRQKSLYSNGQHVRIGEKRDWDVAIAAVTETPPSKVEQSVQPVSRSKLDLTKYTHLTKVFRIPGKEEPASSKPKSDPAKLSVETTIKKPSGSIGAMQQKISGAIEARKNTLQETIVKPVVKKQNLSSKEVLALEKKPAPLELPDAAESIVTQRDLQASLKQLETETPINLSEAESIVTKTLKIPPPPPPPILKPAIARPCQFFSHPEIAQLRADATAAPVHDGMTVICGA